MKDGIVRIALAEPKIKLACPMENAQLCTKAAERAAEAGAALVVFSELALTGATAGDLYLHKPLISASLAALADYAAKTAGLNILSLIGLPLAADGKLYNCAAAVYGGEILAVIPKSKGEGCFTDAPAALSFVGLFDASVPFGRDIILTAENCPEFSVSVSVGEGEFPCPANICVNMSASAELIGSARYTETMIKALSYKNSCTAVYVGAGSGESGTDFIYSARRVAYQGERLLARSADFSDEELVFAECDLQMSSYDKLKRGVPEKSEASANVSFDIQPVETEIRQPQPKSPFVPQCPSELEKRCDKILEIQARGLAKRLERSYSRRAVIGVSGGLDSTLALLVCARAMDILGRGIENIIAVTMPCFGTSERTKSNAELLCEALKTDFRTVDIKESVTLHFSDIGHDPEKLDVVYENSQARERTQVLMDIANSAEGLVVGTGDLSELALGFATYNGDHMSMYGINAGVPKTMMRAMIAHIAEKYERSGNKSISDILMDILNTPISPELLPAKDGEIAQCTEGIVGPYELHDYFIYYTVRYGFSPKKILRIAEASFKGIYEPQVIKSWLKIFLKRFFSSQFKRSCLPDGAAIGSVSLSPRGVFTMPSDASAALWLSELD